MKTYRSFKDARKFVQSLKIKSIKEYRQYWKIHCIPDDLPKSPHAVYKDEWTNWGDFLGTGRIADMYKKFRSYEDARKYVQSLKIKKYKDWVEYRKRNNKPNDIPSNFPRAYKEEWTNWGDFLGTGRIASFNKKFRSYEDAKKFAISHNIKSGLEWNRLCKSGNKPQDIPSSPDKTYEKKWKGWGDFLGTGRIADMYKHRQLRPWKEAKIEYRRLAKKYGLKNREGWKKFVKTHEKELDKMHLAREPWSAYSKESVWRKMK